jgi:hypothetical protein
MIYLNWLCCSRGASERRWIAAFGAREHPLNGVGREHRNRTVQSLEFFYMVTRHVAAVKAFGVAFRPSVRF